MDSAKKTQPKENEDASRYIEYDKLLSFVEEKDERVNASEQAVILKKPTRKKRPTWRRLLFFIFFLLFLAGLAWTSFFVWKISSVSKNIIVENETDASLAENIQSVVAPLISAEHKPLKGEEEGRINILLLGAAGENNPGKNLTDTIMIMSINARSKKIALLSLPRDLYVKVPDTQYRTKINSLYQYGLSNGAGAEMIKRAVEDITNLVIHYFIVLDFEGFKKIIDDVGGINIEVARDIYDSRYPGPNYSYETFEIKKGFHKLDGATALKYVRVRHGDPEGDFGRAKRQQQVIQSTKNKIFSLRTFLNVLTLNKMLNTLAENLKTNIQLDEIDSFIWWSKQVDSQNISNAVVDAWKKDSLLKVSHVYFGNAKAFILIPRVGNYSEIQDLAENIFDLEKIKDRQAKIEKEEAKITVIDQSANRLLAGKIRKTLEEKLGFKSVIIKPGTRGETQAQTLVYDQINGTKIFSLDEIIRKIPARLSATENITNDELPSLTSKNSGIIDANEDSDFVIILGDDLEEIYNYEENTMEELNNAEESQEIILQ